ncbi:MAG: hypothetical protein RBS47_00730, partial [Hydrogenophaga sp.]
MVKNTSFGGDGRLVLDLLVADLAVDLPTAIRLQRLVDTLRVHFGCGAVALLQLEGEYLKPLATAG